MSFAPQQDWDAYRSLVDPVQLAREHSLTATQKYKRYMEIFDFVCAAKGTDKSVRSHRQLEEKLDLRSKLLCAYRLVSGPSGE